MTTMAAMAIIRNLGSISMPLIFMSGEKPIMPAEAIGIETFSCFTDIELGFGTNDIKAYGNPY
jgi:hypothetical protein